MSRNSFALLRSYFASLLLVAAWSFPLAAVVVALPGCAETGDAGADLAEVEAGRDAQDSDTPRMASQQLLASAPDGAGAGVGSRLIVVLGSSTAAGIGASRSEFQWVERYRAYLRQNYPGFELVNLAGGGFTTYDIQPSDYNPPANRPRPSTGRNISYALSLNPGAVIINMPSNDQSNRYALSEQMENYERIASLAAAHGVALFVSTSQPRNFPDAAQRTELLRARDAIRQRFGMRSVDLWDRFAQADGKINPQYDSGDGVHLSDAGHALVAERMTWARIADGALGR